MSLMIFFWWIKVAQQNHRVLRNRWVNGSIMGQRRSEKCHQLRIHQWWFICCRFKVEQQNHWVFANMPMVSHRRREKSPPTYHNTIKICQPTITFFTPFVTHHWPICKYSMVVLCHLDPPTKKSSLMNSKLISRWPTMTFSLLLWPTITLSLNKTFFNYIFVCHFAPLTFTSLRMQFFFILHMSHHGQLLLGRPTFKRYFLNATQFLKVVFTAGQNKKPFLTSWQHKNLIFFFYFFL